MSKGKIFLILLFLLIVGIICYIKLNKDDNQNILDPTNNNYVIDATYSTDNIKLPFINLKNVDNININIKNIYNSNINKINESSYEYFINDKTLSILIKMKIDNIQNYYTYNINIEDGREIKYEEVNAKYSKADITLKEKIGNYIDNSEEIKSHLDEIVLTKEYVVDTTYNNYKLNALNNNVDFFLDSNNHLNVIVKIDLNRIYYEYAILEM